MLMEPLGQAAPDAWVLTMPSFIWTRVDIPESMVRMRSHTCNAVGSQLLIIGGYPPSAQVEKDAPCDPELIKVLNMNDMAWSSRYTPGTVYKTPEAVRRNAEFHLKRVDPQSGWADDNLRDAFHDRPGPPVLSVGEITAIVVSVVIGLPCLALSIYLLGMLLFMYSFFPRELPKFRWPSSWWPAPPRPESPPPDRAFPEQEDVDKVVGF